MNNVDLIPCLFADCIFVKGAKRALLCDLSRQTYLPLGLQVYDLFVAHKGKSIAQLYEIFDAKFVDTYIQRFIENEFVFLTKTPENFPDLDLSWSTPSLFTNSIIAMDAESNHNFELIFQKLEEVNCKDILIRCYHSIEITDFESIMDLMQGKKINSIQWQISYAAQYSEALLIDWCQKYPRINSLILFSAPADRIVQRGGEMSNIYFIKEQIKPNEIPSVRHDTFRLNPDLFMEAQQFNTFYHRKLAITAKGEIKNGLNTSIEFGPIADVCLSDLAADTDFQLLGQINKDRIVVCKDCEFRYCCVDESIPVKIEGLYRLAIPCSYDPYALTWAE